MTIYSLYTYNSGGYGDFIRSLFAIYVYCKKNNIDHKIYIPSHPLNKCIKCITEIINYPTKIFIDCNSKLLFNELELCKNPNYNVIILSNKFDFITFEELKLYIDDFRKYVILTDTVITRINGLNKQIDNRDYVSIHIRCGDKYIESGGQNDLYISNPEDPKVYKRLEKSIEYMNKEYNLPIVIFSDNKTLRNTIATKYNLLQFNTEIGHTATHGNTDTYYIDAIAEFELIGKSKSIIIFYTTGFVYWSAFFNNVSIYICDNNENIFQFEKLIY